MFRSRLGLFNDLWVKGAGLFLLALIAGCVEDRDVSEQAATSGATGSVPTPAHRGSDQKFNKSAELLCARRVKSQPTCNVDFARLAAFYPTIDDLRISITGYLVVDSGMLSLYATEEDYRNYVRSRSVDIRIENRKELKLFSGLLYKPVNVDAIYSRDFHSNNVRGKIGFLSGPFRVYEIEQRNVDQGIEDVLFSARTESTRGN